MLVFQGILQYPVGNVLFGLGDRIICYHQHKRSDEQTWVRNQIRNMFQATLTWAPRPAHQLQGGYYHKFILPNDLRIIQPAWPDLTGSPLRVGNVELEVQKNEEYTLKNISIEIYKKEEKEENVQNETSKIETINIDISQNTTRDNSEKEKISENEKKKLREYISMVYEISEKNININ